VSLDRDADSVAYAQQRYRLGNVSHEVGGIEGLNGETEGAFNAVVAVDPLGQGDDAGAVLSELWRVVAPAGWLLIAGEPAGRIDEAVGRLEAVTAPAEPPTIIADGREGWTMAAVVRPVER
jgi:hypothetical protein